MITALIRAAASAEAGTAARMALRKPNKLLKSPTKAIRKALPTAQHAPKSRVTVRSVTTNRPSGSGSRVNGSLGNHPGNREQPERTYAEKHSKLVTPASVEPTNHPYADIIRGDKQRKVEVSDKMLSGALLLSNANSILSNFIPSVSWTGTCSARGFRDTPLRNVLHYCLAVAFSASKQNLVGGTTLHVHLHPAENRVEVTYSTYSTLVGNLINLPQAVAEGAAQATGVIFNPLNPIGSAANLIEFGYGQIKKYVGDLNPAKALQDFLTVVANMSRRMGPGGAWDMAADNYFAGRPPASMESSKGYPFTDMEAWRDVDKRPLLTKDVSYNPQAPKYPEKHFPTHFDIRSLVSQALYDPGILPPVPDTLVGLPNVRLP